MLKFDLKSIETRDLVIQWIQVLDWVLGHNDALFRRAQLKALVSIHSQEVNHLQVAQLIDHDRIKLFSFVFRPEKAVN